MKKTITVIIGLFILNSCLGFDDEYYYGFSFIVSNQTSHEYNSEIVIGAFKNGVFIPTDSIQINPILINTEYKANGFFEEKNTWKPDMQKIRVIPSDSVFFKIKLTKDRHEFIKKVNSDTSLYGKKIPQNNKFEYSNGSINFKITDSRIGR